MTLRRLAGVVAGMAALACALPANSATGPVLPELVTQRGNNSQIHAFALDRSSRLLATMSDDGLYVWDLAAGRMLRRFSSPEWVRTRTLGFSNDGHFMLDGRQLYDVRSGRVVRALNGMSECVNSFSASHDGRWLASVTEPMGGAQYASVNLWDLRAPNIVTRSFQIHGRGIEACPTGFSADGQRFYSDLPIVERDIGTGKILRTISGDYDRVVAYAPDGHSAVTARGEFANEALALIDLESGKVIHHWAPQMAADGVAFASDGNALAIWRLNSVSIVNIRSGAEKTFRIPGRPVTRIALNRDATTLVAGTLYGDLATVDLKNGRSHALWAPRSLGDVALSPNRQWLATVASGHTTVWDLSTGQPAFVVPNPCEVAVFSPQSRYLACRREDATDVWDLGSWTLAGTLSFSTHVDLRRQASFLGDSQDLAISDDLLDLSMSSAEDAKKPSGVIRVLDFKTGSVGNPLTENAAATILGRNSTRRSVTWIERDGKVREYVAGGSVTVAGTVTAPETDRHYGWGLGWDRPPYGGVAPNAHYALTASRDRMDIFDLTGGAKLLGSIAFKAFKPPASFAGFSPGGHLAAFLESSVWGGYPDTLVLASLPSGRIVQRFAGHSDSIQHFTMSMDEKLLVTSSRDGTVRLWNIPSGRHIGTLFAGGNDPADWLVTDPSGSFDGSPGGWNAILWRFEGDTFNVASPEAFFNDFYDPGLLADLVARRAAPKRSIAAIDRRSPTVAITIAGRPPYGRTVRVNVRVAEAPPDASHPSGSGVGDVRLMRNGSLVKPWSDNDLRGRKTATLTTTVTLVAGSNVLSAYAFNRQGVRSAIASRAIPSGAISRKGTAYLVGIGLNHYSNKTFKLDFARPDATAFVAELRAQATKLGAYGAIKVFGIADEGATKQRILAALADIAKRAQPEDTVILFFAGHGMTHDGRFYLLPYDLGYTGALKSLDAAGDAVLAAHGISDEALALALRPIDARAIVLAIDACQSGQALGDDKRIGPLNARSLAQLAYDKGMYVLAAAQADQDAYEARQYHHGLLTYALVVEALQEGGAAPSSGVGALPVKPWFAFAQRRVPELQRALILQGSVKGIPISFATNESAGTAPMDRLLQRPRIYYPRTLDDRVPPIARFP